MCDSGQLNQWGLEASPWCGRASGGRTLGGRTLGASSASLPTGPLTGTPHQYCPSRSHPYPSPQGSNETSQVKKRGRGESSIIGAAHGHSSHPGVLCMGCSGSYCAAADSVLLGHKTPYFLSSKALVREQAAWPSLRGHQGEVLLGGKVSSGQITGSKVVCVLDFPPSSPSRLWANCYRP